MKIKKIKSVVIIVVVFGAFMGLLWFMGGTAKAEVKTLQESVEMAQSDYDMSQSQANTGLQEYCESWKALALARVQLATSTGLQYKYTEKQLNEVDCKSVNVPISFL